MKAVFETDRLLLRPLTFEDVDCLLGIFSDPEAMRYYPATKSRQETIDWIEWNLNSYREQGFGLWAVIRKDTATFVGQCGLIMQRNVQGSDEVEIGYSFVRGQWNAGFATEAAIGCRDFGFANLNLTRLVSLIDPENHASKRVAEKVGMLCEREIDRWGKRIQVYGIERTSRASGGRHDKRPISIRQATASDAGTIADIYLRSRKELVACAPLVHSDASVREWMRQRLVPAGQVTVAVVDDAIVGLLAVSKGTDCNWIDQLYLLPAWVGQGIGTVLLEFARRELSPPIRLYTFQCNQPARDFYERRGFQPVAFGDGSGNEEKCPDVLYEWKPNQ